MTFKSQARRALSLSLLCGLPIAVSAQSTQSPTPPVVEATLDNGLKILILERHAAPVVSLREYYAVGSVNDVPGRTGLAHLFEHMAFKGTTTINSKGYAKEKPLLDAVEKAADALIAEQQSPSPDPEKLKTLQAAQETAQKAADGAMEKDEFEKIYEQAGAQGLNAHTAPDYTGFEVSLPSNRLELWMAMESDRFKNPVLREFYRERNVVMEERRMNYESSPGGLLWENLVTHAFIAAPYHNEGIGWMDDLKKLTADDARAFFKAHYGPSKVTAVVVGDVDARKTLALFKKYFASIPRGNLVEDRLTREPGQLGERRIVVRFPSQPHLLIGYHKGNVHDPDQPVYEMIVQLLANGRTSRFYKNLVEGKQLAQSADADLRWPGQRYPGLLIIDAEPRAPHTPEELEAGIYAELDKLAKDPIPERELQKVRNQLEASLVERLESNDGMADELAYYQTDAGDWRYEWTLRDALAKVTEADIHRVAAKVFAQTNRTVATLLPPDDAPEARRP